MAELTVGELKHILREGAGQAEEVDLDGDILDISFEELGYDSLAMLEAASRVERHFQVPISEDDVHELTTPRKLLDFVNGRLAA